MSRGHINLASTAVSFLLSMGVGLWFTPFLVHKLGAAGYGLIPLAMTIVSYFSLFTQTFSALLNRQLIFALQEGDRASTLISTATVGSLMLAAAAALPLAALAWYSAALFNIPVGAEGQTRLLFAFVALSFLCSVLSTPFASICFSQNRLDLTNLTAILQSLTRVGVTVALFLLVSPSILSAGLGIVAGGFVSLLLGALSARLALPRLRMFPLTWSAREFREMAHVTGQGLVMQVGSVLTMSSELVLANLLLGEHRGGQYAAVTQLLLLLRNSSVAVAVQFVPTLLGLFARGSEDGVAFTRTAMKWMAIFIALPAGFLCGLAPEVLGIWLGPDFVPYAPLLVLQIAPLVLTTAIVPLHTVTLAAKEILVPGIVQLVTGVVGVGLAIMIGSHSPAGMLAITLTVGLGLAIKEVLFTLPYAARSIGGPPLLFARPVGVAVILFSTSTALAWILGRLILPHTLVALAMAGLLLSLAYIPFSLLLLDRRERSALWGFLTLGGAARAGSN